MEALQLHSGYRSHSVVNSSKNVEVVTAASGLCLHVNWYMSVPVHLTARGRRGRCRHADPPTCCLATHPKEWHILIQASVRGECELWDVQQGWKCLSWVSRWLVLRKLQMDPARTVCQSRLTGRCVSSGTAMTS